MWKGKLTTGLTDSADADITFAAVADMEWLYVALKVSDDIIQTGENVGRDVWQDDSAEVYIDANHCADSKQNHYINSTELRVFHLNTQSFLPKFARPSTAIFLGPVQTTSF